MHSGQLRSSDAIDRMASLFRADEGDTYLRSALVSGLAGRESLLLTRLLADVSWPDSPGGSALLTALANSAFATSAETRTTIVDLGARLAAEDDDRAAPILRLIRAAQRLDSKEPKGSSLPISPKMDEGQPEQVGIGRRSQGNRDVLRLARAAADRAEEKAADAGRACPL